MKKILLSFVALICATVSFAQIGYQVSLLNTATGEPRANETVSCVIELKNSEGKVISSETKSATSNDFGVISLSVGNANTFSNMDWSKLPLFVSVSIDGKLVGQSQVLTVPVAEYAKKTGTLTYENIGQKRVISFYSTYFHTGMQAQYTYSYTYTFTSNSHIVREVYFEDNYKDHCYEAEGEYYIDGNSIWMIFNDRSGINENTIRTLCAQYIQEIDAIIVEMK